MPEIYRDKVTYQVFWGGKGVLLRITLTGRDEYEGGQFSLNLTRRQARQLIEDLEAVS